MNNKASNIVGAVPRHSQPQIWNVDTRLNTDHIPLTNSYIFGGSNENHNERCFIPNESLQAMDALEIVERSHQ